MKAWFFPLVVCMGLIIVSFGFFAPLEAPAGEQAIPVSVPPITTTYNGPVDPVVIGPGDPVNNLFPGQSVTINNFDAQLQQIQGTQAPGGTLLLTYLGSSQDLAAQCPGFSRIESWYKINAMFSPAFLAEEYQGAGDPSRGFSIEQCKAMKGIMESVCFYSANGLEGISPLRNSIPPISNFAAFDKLPHCENPAGSSCDREELIRCTVTIGQGKTDLFWGLITIHPTAWLCSVNIKVEKFVTCSLTPDQGTPGSGTGSTGGGVDKGGTTPGGSGGQY